MTTKQKTSQQIAPSLTGSGFDAKTTKKMLQDMIVSLKRVRDTGYARGVRLSDATPEQVVHEFAPMGGNREWWTKRAVSIMWHMGIGEDVIPAPAPVTKPVPAAKKPRKPRKPKAEVTAKKERRPRAKREAKPKAERPESKRLLKGELLEIQEGRSERSQSSDLARAVSYTHLTLPTILLV